MIPICQATTMTSQAVSTIAPTLVDNALAGSCSMTPLFSSTDVPITIPETGTPVVTSTIDIAEMGTITDINVIGLAGTHDFISDLTITLTSPTGTTVTLFANVCSVEDDFNVSFDASAATNTLPCPPTDGMSYRPSGNLNQFNQTEVNGTWTLTIQDDFDGDGGQLTAWGLEISFIPDQSIPITCNETVSGNTSNGCNCFTAYGCGATNQTGEELIYKLDITAPSQLTITLSDLNADLNLFLVENYNGPPCLAQSITTTTTEQIELGVVAGTYYIIVDGSQAATSTFNLMVTCEEIPCSPILYVNAAATGNNDGTSWQDAFTDLQSAIEVYTLCVTSSSPEIWVAQGTYFPSKDINQSIPSDSRAATFYFDFDIKIYGGFTGIPGTENDFTARDLANPSILSGDLGTLNANADNAYHVVWTKNISTNFVMDGFQIEKGNSNTGGGGWFNENGHPTISHCIFSDNKANNRGGGFYNFANYNRSNPRFIDCLFLGNNSNGGAFSSFTLFAPANLQFINCIFIGNTSNENGGAVRNSTNGGLLQYIFTNCTFSGNQSNGRGGAIYNKDDVDVQLNNCIIWNNQDNSGTGTASSSIVNAINSMTTINYSLIQGQNPSGTGNLDGTDTNNDPLFIDMPNPDDAPSTTGNLRLLSDSPCIDTGNNDADIDGGAGSLIISDILTDIAEQARIFNSLIDMGAYEYVSSCSSIIPITCESTVTGNTNTGISYFSDYSCGANTETGQELIYELVLTSPTRLLIDLETTSGAELDLFLLDGCDEANCLAQSWTTSGDEFIAYDAPAGTYYIVVDGYQGNTGEFVLKVCPNICNDVSPIPITCGQTLLDQNYTGTGISYSDEYPCENTNYIGRAGPEMIYEIQISTASTLDIEVATGFFGDNLDFFLLTDCYPNTCLQQANTGTTSMMSYQATPGTYYVVIDAGAGANNLFDLTINCTDLCPNALPISINSSQTGNNGSGSAVNNFNNYPNCGPNIDFTGPEAIYELTIPSTTEVTIDLTNIEANQHIDLFLLDNCFNNSCIDHSVTGAQAPEQIVTTLEAGTYYIVVDGFDGSVSSFDISVSADVLAVEWLDFKATKKEQSTQLNWTVAQDAQTQLYKIQHRSDQNDWQVIGTQMANKDKVTNAYQFVHEQPVKGINYYRIQEVEHSGKTSFSSIESLTFDELATSITVYPNPTNSVLYIDAPLNTSEQIHLQVFDALGRLVLEQDIQANGQAVNTPVNLKNIVVGVYHLRIDDGKMISVKRVIKQGF